MSAVPSKPTTTIDVLPEVQRPDTSHALSLSGGLNLEEVKSIGELFFKSGMFKDVKSMAQAVTKVIAGQEMGVPPMAAMRGIYVREGNTQLSASLIGSMVKRSGRYDFRVVSVTAEEARIAWFERGVEVGESSFTIADADKARLRTKQSASTAWKEYTEDMLFARALTRGARRYCPDVFGGAVYTLGEDAADAELRPPAFIAGTGAPRPPRFEDPEAPRPAPAATGEAPADVHGTTPEPDGDNLFNPEAEAAASPEPEWVDPA